MLRSADILRLPVTHRNLRTALLIAASLAGAVAAGAFLAAVSRTLVSSVDVVFAIATLVCAAVPLLRRILSHSFDIFEPIVSGSIMLAVLFGLRPLSMVMTNNMIFHGYAVEPQFTAAILLGLIGTAAFVLAYEFTSQTRPSANRSSRPSAYLHLDTAFTYAVLASIVGISLFLVHLALGGSIVNTLRLMATGRSLDLHALTTGSSEYLSSAPILLACGAIVLVVASGPTIPLRRLLLIIVMVAVPVAIFSLTGGRRFIIPSIAIPIIAHYFMVDRRPTMKALLIIIPLVFIILATVPFARARGAREQANGVVPIFADAFSSPIDSWKRFIEGPDTQMISALSIELQQINQFEDFYYGRATIGDFFLAPIPSAIFPNKPTTARNQILIDIFGQPCRGVRGLCPDFSAIGTFYQDLWYAGVVVGMAAFGGLSGWIWRRYQNSRSQYTVIAAACWTVFLPIIIRAGVMPSFNWSLYFFIPSIAGILLISSKRANGNRSNIEDKLSI